MRPDEETGVRGHWGYLGARRLILAEQRIGEGDEAPALRVNCSDGEIVDFGLSYGSHDIGPRRQYYYDAGLHRIASDRATAAPLDERSLVDELSDDERKELIAIASALCAGFDAIRADYYLWNGVWIGELTAYSSSGLTNFGTERMIRRAEAWTLPNLASPDPREALWHELLVRQERGSLQGGSPQGHPPRS